MITKKPRQDPLLVGLVNPASVPNPPPTAVVQKSVKDRPPGQSRSHELAIGSAAKIVAAEEGFFLDSIRQQLDYYVRSQDQAHLWRAWRVARSAGIPSPRMLEVLLPHFDALAYDTGAAELRAEQRERRRWILAAYDREILLWKRDHPSKRPNLMRIRELVGGRQIPPTTEEVVRRFVRERKKNDSA